MTNLAGAVTDSYNYDAFGNLLNPAGATTPNNYRYRGEQYDTDLGLYYLRARYYNPATGRFLSRDPEVGRSIGSSSLHKYLYAGSDPVDELDPTGRAKGTQEVTKPTGDLAEYAGLALQSLNRVAFFAQVTLPEWAGTPAGGSIILGGLYALYQLESILGVNDEQSLQNGPNAAYPVMPYKVGKPTGQDLTETEDWF